MPETTPPRSRRITASLGVRAALVLTAMLALALLLVPPFTSGAAPVDALHDKSCTTSDCHPGRSDEPGLISHPSFLEQWCDRCHTDHTGEAEMLLLAEPAELCLQCHDESETRGHTVIHPPDSGDCTTCHDPHQSTFRHLLREESHLRQCSECHADDLAAAMEKPYHHRFFDPTAECGSCHYAHRSGADGAYLRANLGETCLTCHDMPITKDGRRLENVGLAIRTAPVVHAPLEEQACHTCHTPHGSMQSSLLRENYPAGNYDRYRRETYSLCWTCHDPQLVEATRTSQETRFRDGTRNLHNVHVLQFNRGRACHLCHTAHVSERPHLLRESVSFGEWDSDFLYESLPDGGSCSTACHRPMEYRRSAR